MSKRLIEYKQIRFQACRNHPHSRLYPARASNGEQQDVELAERLKEEDRTAEGKGLFLLSFQQGWRLPPS